MNVIYAADGGWSTYFSWDDDDLKEEQKRLGFYKLGEE